MKYFANYKANGSYMAEPLTSDDLNGLTRDIIEIARGNRQAGGEARWFVCDENTAIVAMGWIDYKGRNHMASNPELF